MIFAIKKKHSDELLLAIKSFVILLLRLMFIQFIRHQRDLTLCWLTLKQMEGLRIEGVKLDSL